MVALSISSIYDKLQKSGADNTGAYTKSDGENIVEIIDTPRMWGEPFDRRDTIERKGITAREEINNILKFIIQKAERNIDIVSLAPPTFEFKETIFTELKKRFSSGHDITLVRFLFGYLPMGTDEVKTFRDELTKEFSNFKNQNLELYVGRVHGGQHGGGGGVLSPQWNHAKIVTADGRYAFVGGHNLWPENYAVYPPVHDISLFIRGDGAEAAQKFANFLWTLPGTGVGGRPRWTRYYKYDFKTGALPAVWETKTASRAVAFKASETVDYVGEERYTSKKVTVLGVGRFPVTDDGVLDHAGVPVNKRIGYASPSEHVKQLIITAASNRLYICQQDLLFLAAKSVAKHDVIKWIVEALTTHKSLVVKIVISSINAKSENGAQYSWGSGALGTYNVLVKAIGVHNKSMLDRLHVAPFCFTNVPISRDGAGAEWKGSERYRCKQAQFSTNIPMPKMHDVIGSFAEPANHAKFYMAVDTSGKAIYYVGSDNLYYHDLFEFGYLIDDKAANTQMYDKYWTEVWKYSGLNCVCDNCRTSARSALTDSLFEYKDSIKGARGLFRNSSAESTRGVDCITAFLKLEGKTANDCNNLILELTGKKPPSGTVPVVGKTFKEILEKKCCKNQALRQDT